jgi:death on curing protein
MNPEPIFLTITEILEIHTLQIRLFGGDPAVLNMGLLESAIAQPAMQFAGEYLHGDIETMAAAYLYHLAKNHPFADGNKRTATHAALVFLRMNGVSVTLPVDEAEQVVLAVAEGRMQKSEIAEYFVKWRA